MKTNFRQLSQIADLNNLKAAWEKIYKRDSAAGLDRKTVQDFANDLENELKYLRDEILEEKYTPTPLLQIKIDKNKPGEKRKLGLPSVRDKVAQEATRSVIEPALDKKFSNRSYGYRANKGPQKGIKRVAHILAVYKANWVVIVDIDEFFPSIDHSILFDLLVEYGLERPVIGLLLLWLRMGTVTTQLKWQDVYHGINQGGVISPLLANCYLHQLDIFLENKNIEFVRYADDIRLFAQTREEAQRAYEKMEGMLSGQLKLQLNELPDPVQEVSKGFSFLGIFFKDSNLFIDPEKWPIFENKVSKIILSDKKNWEDKITSLNNSLVGWNNYYGRIVAEGEMEKITELVEKMFIKKLSQERSEPSKWYPEYFEQAFSRLHIPFLEVKKHKDLLTDILNKSKARAKELQNKEKTLQQVDRTIRRQKKTFTRNVIQTSHLLVTTPGVFLGKNQNRLYARKDRKNIFDFVSAGKRNFAQQVNKLFVRFGYGLRHSRNNHLLDRSSQHSRSHHSFAHIRPSRFACQATGSGYPARKTIFSGQAHYSGKSQKSDKPDQIFQ